MKRKILLAIAIGIFLTCTLNAQIQKKDWLFGGTFGFNYSNSSNPGGSSSSNTNLSPHIAYAVGNNSVVGLNLGFIYGSNKSDINKNTAVGFNTSALFKRYFVIKDKVGWYGGLHAGVGVSKTKQDDGTGNTTTFNSFNLATGIIPGIYYQPSPFLLLTADFGGINYQYYDNGSAGHSSSFGVNFLSSFTFGIDFILRKHSKQ